MNLKDNLPSLFYSVGVRIEVFEGRLNKLSVEKFPTESGEKLVKLFLKGAQRLSDLLEKKTRDWAGGIKDVESIESAVRRIGDSAAILYSFLEYIEAFYFEKTRSEVILPFELLMKEHFPESKSDIFIFYPQWTFNFSYRDLKRELGNKLFLITQKEVDEFFIEVPGRIAVISFPALERDNLLALVVLAHELAHYFDIDASAVNTPDCRISNSPDILKLISIPRDKVRQWIDASKILDPPPASMPPLLADLAHSLRIYSKLELSIPYWLRELTADISAVRFFGLGFYLCARELFTLVVSSPSSPYPPNFKRLDEIALEIFGEEHGFEVDVMDRIGNIISVDEKKFVERIKHMIQSDLDLRDTTTIDQALAQTTSDQLTLDQRKEQLEKAAIKIIEESIKKALIAIKEKVRQKIPLERCSRLSKDIFISANYLKTYIPPAEKYGSQPIEKAKFFDIRIILNAIWLRWLEMIEGFSITKESLPMYEQNIKSYYKELNILSRIALRAIELSNFVRSINQKIKHKLRMLIKRIKNLHQVALK